MKHAVNRRTTTSSGTKRSFRLVVIDQLLRPLLANLWAGFRSAFFVRVDAKSWVVSPEQLIAVAVVAIGLSIALSRTFYSGSVLFNWGGLRAVSFDVPVILLVGLLAARLAVRRVNVLTIPLAVFAAVATMGIVTVVVLHLVVGVAPRKSYQAWAWVYCGYYGWFVAVAAVLLRRTARLAVRYVALAILPLVVASVYDIVTPPQPLWYEMPAERNESRAERESPVMEELLYLQPKLAEQTIRGLVRHRRGVADLYFVGFAPYAHQDVFLNESEVIRNLMDDRFDTYGRSLLLVNNKKTLRQYPLATVTNLRAALQRVGRLIDPDEDVVVLYLTSHGSKTHKLSVSFWPLQLQELSPATVKQLLDEAGIRWRVVIVSACYSGGFIEPLRGPTTLVMTAADAAHTSFGCDADSDFTYFAKALFDEQLRETYSFEEAFARALPIIRERETEEQEDFSNPQIAVGDAIRAKLAEIERRLASAPGSVGATRREAR
jgi:hypothetical protein